MYILSKFLVWPVSVSQVLSQSSRSWRPWRGISGVTTATAAPAMRGLRESWGPDGAQRKKRKEKKKKEKEKKRKKKADSPEHLLIAYAWAYSSSPAVLLKFGPTRGPTDAPPLLLRALSNPVTVTGETNQLVQGAPTLVLGVFIPGNLTFWEQERHFNFFLGGQNFVKFFNATGLLKNWKKQHFICSNLTLFIVPFFLFFLFFSLFSFFSFFFSFSLGGGGDGPPSPPQMTPLSGSMLTIW